MQTQSQKQLRLLIVEDSHPDYIYLWELLREISSRAMLENWSFFGVQNLDTVWVQTMADARQRLEDEKFDAILLDLSLPDSEGIRSLDEIRECTSEVPVVVLSGLSRPDLTFEAVTRGAQDFLVKGQFNSDQLARSIRYAIEQKTIQRKLDQASKHKSQFLANMSHELRTPITSILGYTELLQEDLRGDPRYEQTISAVVRNVHHLLGLLDDILDHSKIEAGKLTMEKIRVRLAQIVAQASSMIEPQAQKKGLGFELIGLTPLPSAIVTDPLRLKQVLVNLLSNAVKFTERGSVALVISYEPVNRQLLFEVRDSGIGISPEKQAKLFEPFAQGDPSNARRFGGSGLGLSISMRLVQLLGGTIELQTAEGRGSTFYVRLTVETADSRFVALEEALREEEAIVRQSQEAPKNLQGRVLLAEDTEDSRELIRVLLQKSGLTVDTAADGREAMEKALKEPFDLVLMDMHMPVLDGYEATRELRKKGYRGTIVALTARVTEDARMLCTDCGCDDYVSKPIRRKEFFRMLHRYLNSKKVIGSDLFSDGAIDDDPETKRIVESYTKSLPDKLNNLLDAMEKLDWKRLKDEAHKLANAEMFGYPQITQLARRMEKASMERRQEEVEVSLASLGKVIGEIAGGGTGA